MVKQLGSTAVDLTRSRQDDPLDLAVDEIVRELKISNDTSQTPKNPRALDIAAIEKDAADSAANFRKRIRLIHSRLRANDIRGKRADAMAEGLYRNALDPEDLERAKKEVHSIPAEFEVLPD